MSQRTTTDKTLHQMNTENQEQTDWLSNDVVAALSEKGFTYLAVGEDVGRVLGKNVGRSAVSSAVANALKGARIRGRQSLLILGRIETILSRPIFPQLNKLRDLNDV